MDEKHGSITITKAAPVIVPVGSRSPWVGVGGQKEPPMPRQPIRMRARSRHLAPNGARIDPQGEYDVYSEVEARNLEDKHLAERISPPVAEVAEGETASEPPAADQPWKLQISPGDYLAKWPEGPNAPQAKATLARKSLEKSPGDVQT